MSELTGVDLAHVFEQYLETTQVPALEIRFDGPTLFYRWADVVPGFDMPVDVTLADGTFSRLTPTADWQAAATSLSARPPSASTRTSTSPSACCRRASELRTRSRPALEFRCGAPCPDAASRYGRLGEASAGASTASETACVETGARNDLKSFSVYSIRTIVRHLALLCLSAPRPYRSAYSFQ